MVSAVTFPKPANCYTSGDMKTGYTAVTICFFKSLSTVAYLQNIAWFCQNFSVTSAFFLAPPML